MTEIEDLFKIEDPFHEDPEKMQNLRLELIKKAVQHHFNNCLPYKKICRKANFNPGKDLKSYDDIIKIPWITSKSFKKSYNLYKNLISVPENQIFKWLHSSGTSGDPSFIARDEKTYNRYMSGGVRELQLLLGVDRFQMGIVFGPPPEAIQDLSFALGMKAWTEQLCDSSVFLMKGRAEPGKMPIDAELTIETLREASNSKTICNVGGSAPLAYFFLTNFYESTGETFDLTDQSFGAGFGGGWKTYTGQQISRDEFRRELNKILGIPLKNIRDIYALTESDIIFQECEEFLYHVPPWGEIIIRNPETMEPVKEGEKGIINIINPLAYSWPGISIILDDVAVLINENECKCGRFGKTFDQIGRAEGAEARGCGAMVDDLGETR